MTNKHIQREWNKFFRSELNKGVSKSQIKRDLIEKGVSEQYIYLKLKNYEKRSQIKKIAYFSGVTVVLIFVLIVPFIFEKVGITGMIIGGPENTYYVDSLWSDS
jgi:hypothetical protein